MQVRQIVPNGETWTLKPVVQTLRVSNTDASRKLLNYSRKWLCLGNKYFITSTITSTSTSGPCTSTSTSTCHASTSTSTSTRKLYLSTDQVPVPVPSTTKLQLSLVPDLLWGRLGTSLITSSQPLMLLLAVFVYDPLTSHILLHVCDCRAGGALKPSWLSSFRLLWLLLITSSIVFHEILGTQMDKCCENDSNTNVTRLSLSSITVAVLLNFLCIKGPIIVGISQRP